MNKQLYLLKLEMVCTITTKALYAVLFCDRIANDNIILCVIVSEKAFQH